MNMRRQGPLKRKQYPPKPAFKQQQPSQPDFIAYAVQGDEQQGQKGYWTKIGAAFGHKDGNGCTILLDALPINARIVLRVPLEQDDSSVPTNDPHGVSHEDVPF